MAAEWREDGRDPLERLIARLALEVAGPGAFRTPPGAGRRRLFGGLVAAQAAMAAQRTAEDRRLHSLHGYFLRAGRPRTEIRFDVERLRDGRSFSVRRVSARQRDAMIFTLTASFCASDHGPEHEEREPARARFDPATLPEPDTLPDWEDVRAALTGEVPRPPDAIELRVVDPEHDRAGTAAPPWRRMWIRPRGRLPDDPAIHAAALVYASDRSLLRTGARLHLDMSQRMPASLDHSVWLHRPPRFDDWLLFASEAPIAARGRVWVTGRMLRRDGTRVATITQEGLIPVSGPGLARR